MSAYPKAPIQFALAYLTTPVNMQCRRCNNWIDAGFGRAPYAHTEIGPCCPLCVVDPLEFVS